MIGARSKVLMPLIFWLPVLYTKLFAITLPTTSNFSDGELVPIPIFPSFFIYNLPKPALGFSAVRNIISPPCQLYNSKLSSFMPTNPPLPSPPLFKISKNVSWLLDWRLNVYGLFAFSIVSPIAKRPLLFWFPVVKIILLFEELI